MVSALTVTSVKFSLPTSYPISALMDALIFVAYGTVNDTSVSLHMYSVPGLTEPGFISLPTIVTRIV